VNIPKVLIVDDTFANRFLLAEILNKNQYKIEEACNGREALDKINAFNPDIVLLDIEMPVMNGYEVIEKLRNMPEPYNKRIVIAVTAHLKENLNIKNCSASFNAVISKPFSPEKINSVIEECLEL
jgi:CheY-like chemotaxis protein